MKLPFNVPWNIKTVLVEEDEDGNALAVRFESVDVEPSADPHVLDRRRSHGPDGTPGEIITHFGPSPERPITFPRDVPFLPNRAAWTTESPAATMSTGARWPCTNPEAVIESARALSIADGWTAQPDRKPESGPGKPAVILSKNGIMRWILRSDHPDSGGITVVQLLDWPE